MRDNTGKYAVHARFGFQHQASITYQRRIIQEKISGHPAFLTGKVAQKQYNHEVRNSRIVLSPFGWGELCFRDYEAVQSGALLVKPDMSHLETWPDIFKAGETYVPVAWDGSDVVEKCEYYLAHDNERTRIVENAYRVYRAQSEQLCTRFQEALSEIAG
jgi:spore maturation protein CgeB